MRRVAAAVIATALLSVAGCSQLSALAPVSGDDITALRTAVYDVLLENDVDILVAPQCEESGAGYTCAGTTIDNEAIAVVAEGDDETLSMTVKVGSRVVYDGNVEDVVQRFAEVAR